MSAKKSKRTIKNDDSAFQFHADFDNQLNCLKPGFLFSKRKQKNKVVIPYESSALVSGMDTDGDGDYNSGRGQEERKKPLHSYKVSSDRNRRASQKPDEKRGVAMYTKFDDFKPVSRALENSKDKIASFQRPPDPPNIAKALRGLPLLDFEKKAEERAVAMVSAWLFDNGLIDELLVHGGISKNIRERAGSSTTATTSAISSSTDSVSNLSVLSQEGFEVGYVSGTPIEGPGKLDAMLARLVAGLQRRLASLNDELHRGVNATPAEYAEVLHAVEFSKYSTTTKKETKGSSNSGSRLGELSTYISNANDLRQQKGNDTNIPATNTLAQYPQLQHINNARHNLKECFQQMDRFHQIPVTCDRLRDLLHVNYNKAMTVRTVSKSHVDMEIMLIQIEAGLKQRAQHAAKRAKQQRRRRAAGDDTAATLRIQQQIRKKHDQVDNLLRGHVKNVWSLGDEIRRRIEATIGEAFDEAMDDSTDDKINNKDLVALVDAINLYEIAPTYHEEAHGLHFTNMRSAALKKLHEHFEQYASQTFRKAHLMALRQVNEDSDDDDQSPTTAVLKACNHLTSEITRFRERVSSCCPSEWAVETLWSTRVAHFCSKQIFDQVGGHHGNMLQTLTVTQLLDLVAWVEIFRESLNESFPHSQNETIRQKSGQTIPTNSAQSDLEFARDALTRANNMLWKVHDLAKDEFLLRTKEQTDEWLDNVYTAEHTRIQTGEGRIQTSLADDCYALANVQVTTIRERLTRGSEALPQAVGVILRNLYVKQIGSRNTFLKDFETCCAATNDFLRMSEHSEKVVSDLVSKSSLSDAAVEALQEQAAILVGLYSSDAIFAAQKVHLYIFEDVEVAIASKMFGVEWVEATYNQYALTLVRTVEDFMGDLQHYLDELMVAKSLDALVKAAVIFYFKCLVQKSTKHRKNRSIWAYNHRALDRMRGDITVMRDYFDGLTSKYPSLKRTIQNEFQVLDTVHELLMIAAGLSKSTERDFIIFLQKHIKNSTITKYVVGDLWHLVSPTEEEAVYELVDSIEEELLQLAPDDKEATVSVLARQTVPGLRLDLELAKLVEKSRRKRARPGIIHSATEEGEIMLNKWKVTIEKQLRKLDMEREYRS